MTAVFIGISPSNAVQLFYQKSVRRCVNSPDVSHRSKPVTTSKHTPIQLPLPIDGAIIEIPLTRGYTTVIDAVDADLSQLNWVAIPVRDRVYAFNSFRIAVNKKGRRSLSRVILARILNRELTRLEYADHIDNNPLNNRRGNLRLATPKENSRNSKRPITNKSGFKGVHFENGSWRASIWLNGRTKHLGNFNSPEDAHEAYKNAAIKHFGEFARFE